MHLYRLWLRRERNLVGRHDFEAEDAMSARFIAAAIADGCGEDCDSFELWENAYRIDAPVPLSADTLTPKRQAQVISTEETMLRSTWAIARSKGLLARLNALKAARA